MRRLILCCGLIALLAAAAACSDDAADDTTTTTPAGSDSEAEEAISGAFISTEVSGHDLVARTQIELDFAGGQLSANAGCNSIGGAYTIEGGTLRFDGEPRSMMMGCDPDLQAQDEWLTGLLTDGVDVTEGDDQLTFTAGDVTMTFERSGGTGAAAGEPAGEPTLVGTLWTLETVIEGETASNVPVGVDAATLTISESLEASVSTGCNTGGTTVTVEGDTLTFAPMRLTMMACEGDAATVEGYVTSVLDGEVSFVLASDTLTLIKDETTLIYRAT